MCECCQSSSTSFFDNLAQSWDSFHDLKALGAQLDSGLEKFGVTPDEHVLDVGCGTGNLTAAIVRRLSTAGKVTAVDLSSVMIDKAQSKVRDSRIVWFRGAVESLDIPSATFDRIICYSVWPHLTDTRGAGVLFRKWLKPGGKLHIWHTISRDAVNKIHSEASMAVNDHLLAPAAQTAVLLEDLGYIVEEMQDNEESYLVTARNGCV